MFDIIQGLEFQAAGRHTQIKDSSPAVLTSGTWLQCRDHKVHTVVFLMVLIFMA